jgi:hypothetical protein
MATPDYEQYAFPERRVIFARYSGPRKGLADASKPLYAWVGTYFKDRIQDVTFCFAERAPEESMGDPEALIDVEMQLELDDYVARDTRLPEGLAIRTLPPETLLFGSYQGPLTGMRAAMIPWIEAMSQAFDVGPGYRQRIVRPGKSPDDPAWEVEIQLARARSRPSRG